MRKQLYQQPITETLVVRFEGVVCNSPNQVRSNSASSGYHGDDNDYDLGEI